MPSENTMPMESSWLACLPIICTGKVLRKALVAAVLVGSILVLLNQGDLLLSGQITRMVVRKALLTPIIPFLVTLLGAFLNCRATSRGTGASLGWPTVRRSLLIAVVVGSIIIALNQGDVLLSGAITPLLLAKIAVTPCVPFCVSLYGAYVAAQNMS